MAATALEPFSRMPIGGTTPTLPSEVSLRFLAKQGQILVGVNCLLLSLCIAAVGGRVIARRLVKATLKCDDYFAFTALVNDAFHFVRKCIL